MWLWRYCCRVSAHWRHGFRQKPSKTPARLQTPRSCSPSVLPTTTLLLWSDQCCEPELVQAKQNPQGTIWFTALPYEQPQAQLRHSRRPGGSGSPQTLLLSPDFSSWNHSLQSPLHCIWGIRYTLIHTQVSWRTAFSQARCLFSCNDVCLPQTSPTFCLSQNLIPYIYPSPVLIPIPSLPSLQTPSALPKADKAPAVAVDLALAQLPRLAPPLWAAALPLLRCSSQQLAPHTSGLTLFYFEPLHSRSTSITSLKIILCNTHRRITSSIHNPVSPSLGQVSVDSIRKAASGVEQLQSHRLKIYATPPVTAKRRGLGRVGERDGKKCA